MKWWILPATPPLGSGLVWMMESFRKSSSMSFIFLASADSFLAMGSPSSLSPKSRSSLLVPDQWPPFFSSRSLTALAAVEEWYFSILLFLSTSSAVPTSSHFKVFSSSLTASLVSGTSLPMALSIPSGLLLPFFLSIRIVSAAPVTPTPPEISLTQSLSLPFLQCVTTIMATPYLLATFCNDPISL